MKFGFTATPFQFLQRAKEIVGGPVHSSEHRVVTTGDGAGGNLKNEKITSCLGSDEQHAPRTP